MVPKWLNCYEIKIQLTTNNKPLTRLVSKRRIKMEKRNLAIIVICTIFLSISFIPSAWGERGVTDSEIRIGQWGPQTGPAAAWGSVARGTAAYFKMINAAGGIHGRKIVYHMFDDGYNPANRFKINLWRLKVLEIRKIKWWFLVHIYPLLA